MTRRPASARRKANGFAMTEMLAAVGIGALIIGALVYLQVDFIDWSRRAMTLGRPSATDKGLIAAARGADRCAFPGAVLALEDQQLQARRDKAVMPLIGLPPGASARTLTAMSAEASPRPGRSMAALTRGDATIAVVALRCDLPEVCRYDPDKGTCGG